ncbi:MAG TPA: transcription antitermination factor NusB [Roseiflexaceae bacterium]|nr:transcription antitermination factor NusB [Roseiflexaceae bacterium]HMP40013.1 transcription antitermination factor NusB [Roseiflexaceae bacterium]
MASPRHRVRILALQTLFELDATDHEPDRVVSHYVEQDALTTDGERFLRRLVFGVWEHYPYLDRIIEEAAPNWPVSQMPGVDKAILRIALYEILIDETEKTPVKVVIDEAVELAKNFGSDNSSRFVNGVLGTIVTRYIERSNEESPEE